MIPIGKSKETDRLERMFTRADLRRMLVPLMIEQALAMTIGMADTVMVASCSEAAVSGV